MKTLVTLFIISGLIFPSFSLAENPAQPKLPENIGDIRGLGEKLLTFVKEELPGIIKKVWKEEVLPIWQKMYAVWLRIWDSTLGPWINNAWQKIRDIVGPEIEKRKPGVEEEFQKEKQELKLETPKVIKFLWEKLMWFIK